jgi:hypothetical protein
MERLAHFDICSVAQSTGTSRTQNEDAATDGFLRISPEQGGKFNGTLQTQASMPMNQTYETEILNETSSKRMVAAQILPVPPTARQKCGHNQ